MKKHGYQQFPNKGKLFSPHGPGSMSRDPMGQGGPAGFFKGGQFAGNPLEKNLMGADFQNKGLKSLKKEDPYFNNADPYFDNLRYRGQYDNNGAGNPNMHTECKQY